MIFKMIASDLVEGLIWQEEEVIIEEEVIVEGTTEGEVDGEVEDGEAPTVVVDIIEAVVGTTTKKIKNMKENKIIKERLRGRNMRLKKRTTLDIVMGMKCLQKIFIGLGMVI